MSSATDTAFVAPSTPLAISGSVAVAPKSAGPYTYNPICTNPAVTVPANLTVVAPPTLILSAPAIVQGSSGATITWNANGNTGCSWSSTDTSFAPSGASGSINVNPAAGSYTYTYTCTGPALSSQTVTLTVVQQPTLTLSTATSVVQGTPVTLSWTGYSSACIWASTDPNFKPATTSSGSYSPNTSSPTSFTYTLTCPQPTKAVTLTLTITPTLAKISISVTPVYDLDIGDPGILSWSLSGGASGCQVSGAWPPYSVPQFSPFAVSKGGSTRVTWNTAGVYTYTLSCTNPSTPVQTSVTITKER